MSTGARAPYAFYLPERSDYTIVDSAMDSVRFIRAVSDTDPDGGLVCRSVDANTDGELIRYRGRLMEGVGYCADSVFGAHVLVRLGRVLTRPELEVMGFRYLDHALAAGFFDDPDIPVFLYRDIETGAFLHNLEARDEYVELGHMARVGYELLCLAALDLNETRAARCRSAAGRIASWVIGTERCSNGWYPRRCTPHGRSYPWAPDSFGPSDLPNLRLPDPIHDRSGSGAFVLSLLAAATTDGILEASGHLEAGVAAFIGADGHFGSTNTDTEDLSENVSYAIAFKALMESAEVLGDSRIQEFAFERCLGPLSRFELVEDLGGLETKGLLYMEDSWNAACTWEMAEAADAYLVAFGKTDQRTHALKALTILRALAKHHYGPVGFMTEAIDWDGHSVAERHIGGQRNGPIQTTHPFLNNLHLVLPTTHYLEEFAMAKVTEGGVSSLVDLEGNRLCASPYQHAEWMDE